MTERQYAAAGVDLEIAEASKARIARLVESTRTSLAAGAVGSFGGMVRVPTGYRHPLPRYSSYYFTICSYLDCEFCVNGLWLRRC